MSPRQKVRVLHEPNWRESDVNSSCTNEVQTSRSGWLREPARGCGMEAGNEAQHRTRVNSGAGRTVWVSVPSNATPDIQSRRYGNRSGGGVKSCVLIPGDLLGSASSGRIVGDDEPMSEEKSDHPIGASKSGNADGAKGMTG